MTNSLSGPMFEASKSKYFKSCFDKSGAHYNVFHVKPKNGMDALRQIFEYGDADDLNFCLFSTSGVHGSYQTIEEAESYVLGGSEDKDGFPDITFLIVHPRLCCLRYGNCIPKTKEDFAYLKRLRETSWRAILTIGRHKEAG